MKVQTILIRTPGAGLHLLTRLMLARRQRVVLGAQSRPVRRDRVDGFSIADILGEDDGETSIQVEVDVTVEEPRARVVRLEADRDVVVSAGPGRDSVAPDGVVVVVDSTVRAANDGEGMTMQVNRVLDINCFGSERLESTTRKRTHRTAS